MSGDCSIVRLSAHCSVAGRYGRSRIFSEFNGLDDSITDGRWIITVGTSGIVGFLAEFGLLALAVFRAPAALRYTTSEREQFFFAGLALIVGISVIELLPNSTRRLGPGCSLARWLAEPNQLSLRADEQTQRIFLPSYNIDR